MPLLPTSQDEPALQDALVAVILKLVLGVAGSAGLFLSDKTVAAVSVVVATAVAAGISYVQGRSTRGKVIPPAHVDAAAVQGAWPDLSLPSDLTFSDGKSL